MAKIAIVAGEASGDLLGSHLIKALKEQHPNLQFFGIAGPKMQAEGTRSLYPIERLSIRGYVEVLRHLWGLLKLRRNLAKTIISEKPDLFIGIDAPDFNFALEKKLKSRGIPTIHYVSPSLWAWRGGRISKIKRAVTHILALFPFEPKIYHDADIPVTYVGHPLADMFPITPDVAGARYTLKIKLNQTVITLMPGSRQSEVFQHADLLINTAKLLILDYPEITFLAPLITRETRDLFQAAIYKNNAHALPIQILFGHSDLAMEAADMVIVASGTATLEVALMKKPMVIIYKMPNLSWQILKRMRYQPYVGLPNILAGRFIVPELLQHDASPEKLRAATLNLLTDKAYLTEIKDTFSRIHQELKQNTAQKAAKAILAYL